MSQVCWNQCDTLPLNLAGQTVDKQDQKNQHVHGIMQRAVVAGRATGVSVALSWTWGVRKSHSAGGEMREKHNYPSK